MKTMTDNTLNQFSWFEIKREDEIDEEKALEEYRAVWAEAEIEELGFDQCSPEPEGISILAEWQH